MGGRWKDGGRKTSALERALPVPAHVLAYLSNHPKLPYLLEDRSMLAWELLLLRDGVDEPIAEDRERAAAGDGVCLERHDLRLDVAGAATVRTGPERLQERPALAG